LAGTERFERTNFKYLSSGNDFLNFKGVIRKWRYSPKAKKLFSSRNGNTEQKARLHETEQRRPAADFREWRLQYPIGLQPASDSGSLVFESDGDALN